MDVIVTDHHSPRADGALPDAPIVHPRIGGYPCVDLCAAAVAHKLAQALLAASGEDPRMADEDLDLVALATVADVVPLLGENRRLVRAGLRALASTRKPGLRALMDVARVDPSTLDAARDRLPARPPAERRRAPLPRRRRTGAAAHRGRRARPRRRPRAGREQHRAPRRRDADPLRGRGTGRRARLRRRLRPRVRRLARRRDRDRRRADRRAPLPPVRADRARRGGGHGLRALDPRLRPAGRPARGARRPCCATAATAPPPAYDRPRRRPRLPRGVRRPRRKRARARGPRAARSASTPSPRATR